MQQSHGATNNLFGTADASLIGVEEMTAVALDAQVSRNGVTARPLRTRNQEEAAVHDQWVHACGSQMSHYGWWFFSGSCRS